MNYPQIDLFPYSHHLSGWYCIDMGVKGLTTSPCNDSYIIQQTGNKNTKTSRRSCCPDLTLNSPNWFTRKCVAARRENWQSYNILVKFHTIIVIIVINIIATMYMTMMTIIKHIYSTALHSTLLTWLSMINLILLSLWKI